MAATAALALHGGSKAVQTVPGKWVRWGEEERQQVGSIIDQPSLFYFANRRTNTQTTLFIERIKQHCPNEHVVTCSSGTAAVHIAVTAAGVGPGDEVITTPLTDIGTVSGILFQQAVPVFADLGRSTERRGGCVALKAVPSRTGRTGSTF